MSEVCRYLAFTHYSVLAASNLANFLPMKVDAFSNDVATSVNTVYKLVALKAGGNMKAVFWLGIMFLINANILSTFQAIKNLSAHLTYLYFGLFCKFFGDF